MTDLALKSAPEYSSKPRILDTGAEILTVVTDENGRITVTENTPQSTDPRATSGLIDLQVNGFGGVDFNDAAINADDIDHALFAMLATGVTTCLPTIITAPKDILQCRLQALDRAVGKSRLGPLMVPGYHLEGPFLNPQAGYAGCHSPQDMILPSVDLVKTLERELCRPILYITLAPELDHADQLISWAVRNHKIVGAGHTAVTLLALGHAVEHGLQISTHLGNGVPQMLHKFNNSVLWQLAEDQLGASFIADGIHIPPDILKIFIRAKGIEKSILVTDGTSASNSLPGRYSLAGMAAELDDNGRVNLSGSSLLAGSALALDQAVANMVKWNIVNFRSALRMASANPRALLMPALQAHGVTITLGEVIWGPDYHPVMVNLGCCRYQKDNITSAP